MRIPFTSRLWLAWQVLSGTITSAQWDSRGSTIVEFENTQQFNHRMRSPR